MRVALYARVSSEEQVELIDIGITKIRSHADLP